MPICFVVHLFITIVNDGYLSSKLCGPFSISEKESVELFYKVRIFIYLFFFTTSHVEHQWQPSESKIGWPYYHQTVPLLGTSLLCF